MAGPIDVTFNQGPTSGPCVDLTIHTERTLRFESMEAAMAWAELEAGVPQEWDLNVNRGGVCLYYTRKAPHGANWLQFTAAPRGEG